MPAIAEWGARGASLMTDAIGACRLEKGMGKDRVFPQRRQTNQLVDFRKAAHTAYALYETAWVDAWPHLDDWFTTKVLLRQLRMAS